MTALDDDNTRRYLTLTEHDHSLASIGAATRSLQRLVDAAVWDDDDDSPKLPDGLTSYRDDAGLAAVGVQAPREPDQWTRAYADALTDRLDTVARVARELAESADAVRAAVAASLITTTRSWSPEDITGGVMAAYLDELAETGGDAAHLWGCIVDLCEYRDDESINRAVYDDHMSRIARLWADSDADAEDRAKLGDRPGRFPIMADAERVAAAVDAWRRGHDAANDALAEPIPYLRAAQIINGCETFDRLTHYAAALTGPAWSETAQTTDTYDNARQAADRLMIALARRYNTTMTTDAAGVHRADATELADIIDRWRERLFDDAATFANTLHAGGVAAGVYPAALEDVYKRLYRAADVAVTTSEMVEVWNAADVLDAEQAAQVRTVIALRFDDDNALPGFGRPLDAGGPHQWATRALRTLVDAHDMPSNAAETNAYRDHAAALDELDMRDPVADMKLCRMWSEIVTDADAGAITRRQTAALRDTVNAKIAEYSGGSEYKAGALASRLPEWERITDELDA